MSTPEPQIELCWCPPPELGTTDDSCSDGVWAETFYYCNPANKLSITTSSSPRTTVTLPYWGKYDQNTLGEYAQWKPFSPQSPYAGYEIKCFPNQGVQTGAFNPCLPKWQLTTPAGVHTGTSNADGSMAWDQFPDPDITMKGCYTTDATFPNPTNPPLPKGPPTSPTGAGADLIIWEWGCCTDNLCDTGIKYVELSTSGPPGPYVRYNKIDADQGLAGSNILSKTFLRSTSTVPGEVETLKWHSDGRWEASEPQPAGLQATGNTGTDGKVTWSKPNLHLRIVSYV